MDLSKIYVCVDTETTGLDSNINEIVEVTARRFKEDGSLGKEFYQLCRPSSGIIPAEATAIHGITSEMVKDCPNYLKDGVREALMEFIGDRKVIGHNLIDFDAKFIKIDFKEVEDTLLICRDRYGKGKNNLRKACERANIKFDPKEAHGSRYDVQKTTELYLWLKNFGSSSTPVQQNMFAQPAVETTPAPRPLAIQDVFTQPYSFSRINLFHQCPFKWKMRYIERAYEPPQDYLIAGKVCHKIAENTSVWCYRETFANKFVLYSTMSDFVISEKLLDDVKSYYECEAPSKKQIGHYLFENSKGISTYTQFPAISIMIIEMNKKIEGIEYEMAGMPDLDTFNKIMQDAFLAEKVTDPDIIRDVEFIMLKFYKSKDFSNAFGQIALVEKRLAFDKEWNYVADWRSDSIFFRGIIDLIEYHPEYVMITDYKTSRTMLTIEQLKRDIQLKVYLLLLWKFLPAGSIKRVIVKIEYLRYGKSVEYEVENVELMAKEAMAWIEDSITSVENELAKDPKDSFKPIRNEYCYCCHLGDTSVCPLFNRKHINNIDDIESFEVKSSDDCKSAWKRVEANRREIKNLTEKCKAFVSHNEMTKVMIDELAKLDFYAEEKRSYEAEKVMPLLLKKGISIKDALPYFSISPTNVEKILNKNKIELTAEELDKISIVKIKHEFDACTEDEARGNGYLNS